MRPTPAVHCKHAEKIERRLVQKNNDDPKENIIILKDTKYTVRGQRFTQELQIKGINLIRFSYQQQHHWVKYISSVTTPSPQPSLYVPNSITFISTFRSLSLSVGPVLGFNGVHLPWNRSFGFKSYLDYYFFYLDTSSNIRIMQIHIKVTSYVEILN